MTKVYIVDCVIHERRIVEAETNKEAFEKAEQWYKETGQTFDYIELEISL